MKRRQFLQKGIYASFVMAAAPVIISSCSKGDDDEKNPNTNTGIQIDLNATSYNSLNSAGNFLYYQNIIIINTGTSFIAMSKLCTHEGCTISYDHAAGNLPCGCHGSKFSQTGSVINGPAVTALKTYSVSRNVDVLTIK